MDKNAYIEAVDSLVKAVDRVLGDAKGLLTNLGEMRQVYKSHSEGQMSGFLEYRPDYRLNLSIARDSIKHLSQFDSLMGILRSIRAFDENGACAIIRGLTKQRYSVEDLIFQTLNFVSSFNSSNILESIEQAYQLTLEFFEHSQVKQFGYYFIENLDLSCDELSLSGSISIRKLSLEEKLQWLNTNDVFESVYGFTRRPPFYSPRDVRAVLSFTCMEPVEIQPVEAMNSIHSGENTTKFPPPEVEVARLAMRVAADDVLSIGPLIAQWRSTPLESGWSIEHFDRRNRQTPIVRLDSDGAHKVFDIFKSAARLLPANTTLKIALERLESFSARTSPEDKILDLFIGFEAVVLGGICKQKSHGEMTFRLATVLSRYLEESFEDRKYLYDLIKSGYDLRSKIVHGASAKNEDIALANKLAQTYRLLLRKWIADVRRGAIPSMHSLLLDP